MLKNAILRPKKKVVRGRGKRERAKGGKRKKKKRGNR